MPSVQRTSRLAIAAFAVVGAVVGLLLQLARSAKGQAPIVPPLSLALTLLVLGGVLLWLAIALRRAVVRKSKKPVNPFHAVRLLAGARAGQFVGALIGGFGGGLALQLLSRSVMPPAATWAPMLFVLGAGIVLLVCGIIAELLCRVPPDEGDDANSGDSDAPAGSGAGSGAGAGPEPALRERR